MYFKILLKLNKKFEKRIIRTTFLIFVIVCYLLSAWVGLREWG